MSVRNSITGPFAEITVGKGSSVVVFTLPKELLCNSSTYFKAALNNGFSESITQKITLDDDDDDPEIFRTYAAWLFEHEIVTQNLAVHDIEHHLFHVYIFADKRGIVDLANDVVTVLASFWTWNSVDMDVTIKCLPLLSPRSTLYQLVLDSLVIDTRAFWWDTYKWEILSRHPGEFIVELFKRDRAFHGHFKSHYRCIEAICHYHEHSGDEEKDECITKTEGGRNNFNFHHGPSKQIKWTW
ncbi:hypothetical protein E4T52_08026 [Aureobasidium sp. EXF-3400]|nr:hypothetical protein E4T51_03667 [Aureobasidium sp. EXF-12344]KAI4777016.1 hypothetical protein E4T52_08026 [Aureobasidium sp. EXF-3400]